MANSINLDVSQRVDITCRKGDSFELDLDITDESGNAKDISSYSFKMEVRKTDTSNTAYADGDNTIILSTEDGDGDSKEITYTTPDAQGNVTFNVTATNMRGVDAGLYVYDIEAKTGSSVTTWLHGLFKVNEDVTV